MGHGCIHYKKCIKLGKCICPIERDNTYKTGELKTGHYIMIWKIKNKDPYECEKLLQYLLEGYHKYYDGGTEFLHQNLKIPCKKGLTLIWPAAWTHTHRGVIDENLPKTLITGWIDIAGGFVV